MPWAPLKDGICILSCHHVSTLTTRLTYLHIRQTTYCSSRHVSCLPMYTFYRLSIQVISCSLIMCIKIKMMFCPRAQRKCWGESINPFHHSTIPRFPPNPVPVSSSRASSPASHSYSNPARPLSLSSSSCDLVRLVLIGSGIPCPWQRLGSDYIVTIV